MNPWRVKACSIVRGHLLQHAVTTRRISSARQTAQNNTQTMAPQLIFGTGVLGMDGTEFQDKDAVTDLLSTLKQLGINRLDTAARYPPFNPGRSEQLIGEADTSGAFVVDTKVYTEVGDGSGDLTQAAMQKSVGGSLSRLQRPHVNVLFAHRPDPATPLEEQVRGFQDQVSRGLAREWGVANHPPEALERIIALCAEKGWAKPTWYQGTYNMLTRGAEARVLPVLRAHGMSFLASHALASGFLTGGHVDAEGRPTGRFAKNANLAHPEVAAAMKEFVDGCSAHDLQPVEVASRWTSHHSALGDGDAIVLGASKLEQVGDTVAHISKGPLPQEMVVLVDRVWATVTPIRGSMI
ncbi:hypothetical protein KVR01_013331 [Diaporthe batatas]|uniref:uncharacterized protein n=1 Tax=Diaporthe batatas TaxID=748121 RepID=UPI001D03D1FC|nr:uncharacterized protein KVR01_013331 [Diaporthe batatas]KAG8156726.1 hypothetical protein KVR01_013331 [Diaporthe batatas]